MDRPKKISEVSRKVTKLKSVTFFSWGHLKTTICQFQPVSLDELSMNVKTLHQKCFRTSETGLNTTCRTVWKQDAEMKGFYHMLKGTQYFHLQIILTGQIREIQVPGRQPHILVWNK